MIGCCAIKVIVKVSSYIIGIDLYNGAELTKRFHHVIV